MKRTGRYVGTELVPILKRAANVGQQWVRKSHHFLSSDHCLCICFTLPESPNSPKMPQITRESAAVFFAQLRHARLAALGDAEGFEEIVHVIERLGSYISKETIGDMGNNGSLKCYKNAISQFAQNHIHPDAVTPSRSVMTRFSKLYESVRIARNDAVHQGAYARHLTVHAINLAIMLEEILSTELTPIAADFMVRNPQCAELWQPLAFLRQQILANSYTHLPVLNDGEWRIVSDRALGRFLGHEREGRERRRRLSMTLKDAIANSLVLEKAEVIDESATIEACLAALENAPVLLVRNKFSPDRLDGLLTAFDLL